MPRPPLLNYADKHETIHFESLLVAKRKGTADSMKAFVDACMAEYDLNGSIVSDLVELGSVSYFG